MILLRCQPTRFLRPRFVLWRAKDFGAIFLVRTVRGFAGRRRSPAGPRLGQTISAGSWGWPPPASLDRTRGHRPCKPRGIVERRLKRIGIAALALARHQGLLGREPSELNTLVPGVLPALPRDGMKREPLRFRAGPGVGFVLYAVGADCKDDHGDPAPTRPEARYRRLAGGHDAVCPAAANEAGAEAAMKTKHE
jgi:hypothetical protein